VRLRTRDLITNVIAQKGMRNRGRILQNNRMQMQLHMQSSTLPEQPCGEQFVAVDIC